MGYDKGVTSKDTARGSETSLYRALAARDRRFDGVFFIGVTTTGIYCRPVCPARTPRSDRCRFFRHRSEAEAAGFRPCLRCRPEHAPGRADTESLSRLAKAAAEAIDAGELDREGLEGLAAKLTVSTRHLRRAFQRELGVSPLAWAQERRLALARTLVIDTALPLTHVAQAAGYRSLRRFNDAFLKQLGRAPSTLRRTVESAQSDIAPAGDATFTVRLDYRPPLPWTTLLAIADRKAIRGVERVEGERYSRTLQIGARRGWLTLEPVTGKSALRLTVPSSLLPVLRLIILRVRQQWDLDARPDVIEGHLGRFAELRPSIVARPGMRLVGSWDPFEGSVRVVLGQQCSVVAAATLGTRFAARAGEPLKGAPFGLERLFPTAETVAAMSEEDVARIGLPRSRARTLLALARVASTSPGDDLRVAMERESAERLPGIGPWTRALFALRVARHPDTFPAEDLVLRRVLHAPADALHTRAVAWSPWRSYAAVHLWASAASPTG